MCCSFVIPFFVFGLRVFFNSPTQFPPIKQGGCAALCDYFVFKSIFQQSTKFSIKQGLSDVLLFVIPFFVFV
jgi:hypothetical protein